MMMPPGLTGWPPYTLTPRLCPLESLPFLVLPPPFLWAASMVRGTRAGHTQGAGACILTPKKPVWLRVASIRSCFGGKSSTLSSPHASDSHSVCYLQPAGNHAV